MKKTIALILLLSLALCLFAACARQMNPPLLKRSGQQDPFRAGMRSRFVSFSIRKATPFPV